MKKSLTLVFLLISSVTFAAAWAPDNNPYIFGKEFKSQFNELPESGHLKDQRLGWPGSHWSNNVGGIANRWSSGNPQNFKYNFLSLPELQNLEPHQLAELSPAEKFDILQGDYTYSTVRKVYRTVSPYENEWHGICHGYAPAALNHPEPATVKLTNPDGIKIHFYSSDVAALMSFYYAKVASTRVKLIGNRCKYNPGNVPRRAINACNDMNPGSFHLLLTNKLGIEGTGFIVDTDRYLEVWNHIAVASQSFSKTETGPVATSAAGTVRRVEVELTVTYAAAIAPKFNPVLNTENAEYMNRSYEYFLDLDAKGNVIGGDWIGEERPDFAWTQEKAEFIGPWSVLSSIYRPAINI